ncbi:MAG: type II DNA modification enzyme, partial [Deltaproteobacteria bacterium]|nr:type II DNA modification enzyme [Deltaproteobacteria bacterium]
MARRTNDFQAIRSEGGLLPPDLLRRVLDSKEKLPGTRSEDYGLPQGERLNDMITQSWNRLRKHWAEFRSAAESLPEGEAGTGLTNEKWNLPLLRELAFGLLPTSAGPEVGGRTYAINRFYGPVPVHLIGCGLSLDRRAAGVRGAAAANPHGLVQEFLNRSSGHVWAILSNGLRFRILRDNQALSRQSFLEFDLEAMFAGEVYSDFVLLWLMAHATRFTPREGDRPETCWLEQWTKLADEQGTRALGDLRGGVEKALQVLGEGFTSHPKNAALRDALRAGELRLPDFHAQLLRVVYRLIFLFVSEDRTLDGQPLLHARDDSESAVTARERYAAHYSTDRLRELASKIKGSRHG